MIKILELFSGIGACSKALSNLNIEHEIVDAVEIDKYAVKSFNAVHNTNFEPQDITGWDKNIECDLIMHGSPCQDFSLAGKQAGGDEGTGTRSSLMYESIRIIEKLKPKYVIWENVKNLLSDKHRHNFMAYLKTMESLGYINHYKVLNAKNYGIPQNRERIFTVSIRDDVGEAYSFNFPEEQPLTQCLRDILEQDVADKYYLSDKALSGYLKHSERHKDRGNGFKFEPTMGESIAHCVSTKAGSRPTDNYIIEVNRLFGIFDEEKSKHQAGSVYDKNGLCPTLDTMQGGWRQPSVIIDDFNNRKRAGQDTIGTLTTNCGTEAPRNGWKISEGNFGIRRLTPTECWKLMGFNAEDCEKARRVGISDTQLYKQAGNSIVVNVLEAILKNLL